MTAENAEPIPVEAADAVQPAEPIPAEAAPKRRGGRRKAAEAKEVYPRAGEVPTAAEIAAKAEVQRKEAEANAEEAAKAPWPSFNKPPTDPTLDQATLKTRQDANEAKRLTLAPGCKYYRAKRNCRNGKYRQGKIYALPEPQPAALFDPIE